MRHGTFVWVVAKQKKPPQRLGKMGAKKLLVARIIIGRAVRQGITIILVVIVMLKYT
jgi:hypothetical protein